MELNTGTLLKAWPAERKDGSAGQAPNPEGLYTGGCGGWFLDMVEFKDSDHSGSCAELGASTLSA